MTLLDYGRDQSKSMVCTFFCNELHFCIALTKTSISHRVGKNYFFHFFWVMNRQWSTNYSSSVHDFVSKVYLHNLLIRLTLLTSKKSWMCLVLNNKANNVLGAKYYKEWPHKCKFKYQVLASTNISHLISNKVEAGTKAKGSLGHNLITAQ